MTQIINKVKIVRIVNGSLWVWESNGDYLRMIRLSKIKDVEDIGYYAEKLVNNIIKNSKQIVYNLK
jgi:hypothetical protein